MSLFYYLQQNDKAILTIYDLGGKLLHSQDLPQKGNMIQILSSNFESGIYYYSIVINDETTVNKKLVIIK